ncbi:PQQ-dependent sugar dehydrogenase [Kribbella sandramycini]|uniref:PQQ-dependent sugar dehydrogenase n=1 Tax=Kribbella sandramycini TaxID=60450 RepID=A0A7Y4L3X3_9ACTN|nr:PQQ-dependent sugar dehydrogenase [Kribbella sandramycini]
MRVVAAVAAVVLVAGCSGADGEPGAGGSTGPTATATGSGAAGAVGQVGLRVESTVVSGLEVPWGVAFLPDESALVSERDSGKVRRVVGGTAAEVGTVEGVDPSSEGGLLGLAVDGKGEWVYAYYSTASDNRIAKLRYAGGKLAEQRVIVEGIPQAAVHNGGRLRFGADGFLYVGTGDGGDRPLSQDDGSLGGKVLRVTTEGKAAPGNPGGRLWISKGHRNVQGLAFDEGQLYAAEFGQNTWDELNAITVGANYGWPAAEGAEGLEGMTDPIAQWRTSEASPSGVAFARGHIFMASLRGERLWAVPVAGGKRVGEPRAFFTGEYGRLRTVEAAPDGSLWVTTSNTDGRGDAKDGDDRILRVTIS